ncbi:MAG: hypothetical protein FJ109_17060 [Deltaproteobacteria bacterium]|nr:hypothetical protein [Deltaproteobacteria bacterium]
MTGRVMKTFILGVLVVCLLTLLGIYHVWRQFRLVCAGGELAKASLELENLTVNNELLKAEYLSLRTSQRFRPELFLSAGMKQPASNEVLVVKASPAEGSR